MDDEEYYRIKAFVDMFDDLEDGAFFAAMEDQGISTEEMIEWYQEGYRREGKVFN